jgi:hypothetical protein
MTIAEEAHQHQRERRPSLRGGHDHEWSAKTAKRLVKRIYEAPRRMSGCELKRSFLWTLPERVGLTSFQ